MNAHTCGRSDLDPGDCPACRQEGQPFDYGERMQKVEQAMAWSDAGLCTHCGGPVTEDGECAADLKESA